MASGGAIGGKPRQPHRLTLSGPTIPLPLPCHLTNRPTCGTIDPIESTNTVNNMTTQAKLKDIKSGEYFKLKDTESAPVWVRGEYCRTERKFNTFKWTDFNHSRSLKGDTLVFVGFTF